MSTGHPRVSGTRRLSVGEGGGGPLVRGYEYGRESVYRCVYGCLRRTVTQYRWRSLSCTDVHERVSRGVYGICGLTLSSSGDLGLPPVGLTQDGRNESLWVYVCICLYTGGV